MSNNNLKHQRVSGPAEQWAVPKLHQPADWFAAHSLSHTDGFFEAFEFYDCVSDTAAETSHEQLKHSDAVMS